MILVAAMLAATAHSSPPGLPEGIEDARMIHGYSPSPNCREWARERRSAKPRANPHESWVMGVLTGHNLYHPKGNHDILGGTSLASVFAEIDVRCARNPEAALADVALDVIIDLRSRLGL